VGHKVGINGFISTPVLESSGMATFKVVHQPIRFLYD